MSSDQLRGAPFRRETKKLKLGLRHDRGIYIAWGRAGSWGSGGRAAAGAARQTVFRESSLSDKKGATGIGVFARAGAWDRLGAGGKGFKVPTLTALPPPPTSSHPPPMHRNSDGTVLGRGAKDDNKPNEPTDSRKLQEKARKIKKER